MGWIAYLTQDSSTLNAFPQLDSHVFPTLGAVFEATMITPVVIFMAIIALEVFLPLIGSVKSPDIRTDKTHTILVKDCVQVKATVVIIRRYFFYNRRNEKAYTVQRGRPHPQYCGPSNPSKESGSQSRQRKVGCPSLVWKVRLVLVSIRKEYRLARVTLEVYSLFACRAHPVSLAKFAIWFSFSPLTDITRAVPLHADNPVSLGSVRVVSHNGLAKVNSCGTEPHVRFYPQTLQNCKEARNGLP